MAMYQYRRWWFPVDAEVPAVNLPEGMLLKRMLDKGLIEEIPPPYPDYQGPKQYRLSDKGWEKARGHAEHK